MRDAPLQPANHDSFIGELRQGGRFKRNVSATLVILDLTLMNPFIPHLPHSHSSIYILSLPFFP
jgi:hypothetical protein